MNQVLKFHKKKLGNLKYDIIDFLNSQIEVLDLKYTIV